MRTETTLAEAVNPERVLADLRALAELTGDRNGAQRLCWGEGWTQARGWMRSRISEIPLEHGVDAAGNAWATLPGEDPDRALLIGSHIDSVPDGGWLDGCLGLLAGLEVMRVLAEGEPPPSTVRLVDWADEEGARFGRGLIGSSAASGSLDPADLRPVTDRDGRRMPDVLAECGIELARMQEARRELETAASYLELHIEQGPELERLGLPLAAAVGTAGVERHVVSFKGQASHAGSTPMDMRRDPLAAAARFLLDVRPDAKAAGAVATVGSCVTEPGIATATPAEARVTLDQRHIDRSTLAELVQLARQRSRAAADAEGVDVEWTHLWAIEPIHFDQPLVELTSKAIRQVAGSTHRMASGPLHDAAEVARAGVPTAMIFVQSLGGLSHTAEEDTRPEEITLAVRALAGATEAVLEQLAGAGSEGVADLPGTKR